MTTRIRILTLVVGLLTLGSPASPAVQSDEAAPAVEAVSVQTEHMVDDHHTFGEVIWVEVTFSRAVVVTGAPTLEIEIGTEPRQAEFWYSGVKSGQLFRYEVTETDLDEDGISIRRGALRLNGGSIKAPDGTVAARDLGEHAVADMSGHRVDGGVSRPPAVASVLMDSAPARGDVYGAGQSIRISVTLSKPVWHRGWVPDLTIMVGGEHRDAEYRPDDSSENRFLFGYTVTSGDLDADGISVPADAWSRNAPDALRSVPADAWSRNAPDALRDARGTAADLHLGEHAIVNSPGHKVDGVPPVVRHVDIVSKPKPKEGFGAAWYRPWEVIAVVVAFNENVELTSVGDRPGVLPTVNLTVGVNQLHANYDASRRGPHALMFTAGFRPRDYDWDGVSVTGVSLNGWRLLDRAGNDAELGFGAHAIANDLEHRVSWRFHDSSDCGGRCPTLVFVPSGTLLAGSPSGNEGHVEIAGFGLGRYEISVGQWSAFVNDTEYSADGCNGWSWSDPGFEQGPDHPVVCINLNDAKAYLQWLSLKTGASYRLPTTNELAYALQWGSADAPTVSTWRDTAEQCSKANGSDQSRPRYRRSRGHSAQVPHAPCDDGFPVTSPRGSFEAAPVGVFDLVGNAWEWSLPSDKTGSQCEFFGGGFMNASNLGVLKKQQSCDRRINGVGFRVVREIGR